MSFLTKARDELRQVGLVTLPGYHLFVAADSRLGKGTLWRVLWGRE